MPAAARDPEDAAYERHIRLAGTRNLRDVGGYPAAGGRRTRWRTLLRTDALDRIPAASQASLLDLGLAQVIDLRWPHELVEAPNVFGASDAVRYRNIPIFDEDPGPGRTVTDIYRLTFDARGPQLVEVVRALLEPGGLPAVIGCAAGKDRTGVAIALVLAVVGVPPDVVASDYALSADSFAAEVADEHLTDWRAAPADVDCRPEYMLEALDHLERRHGGAAGLLARQGVTEGEVARLVDLLTEPDSGTNHAPPAA